VKSCETYIALTQFTSNSVSDYQSKGSVGQLN